MTRQTKTARQRAEEALGIAQRRHQKALASHTAATEALTVAEDELEEAQRLHEYAKAHPALKPPKPTQTPSTTPTPKEGTNP